MSIRPFAANLMENLDPQLQRKVLHLRKFLSSKHRNKQYSLRWFMEKMVEIYDIPTALELARVIEPILEEVSESNQSSSTLLDLRELESGRNLLKLVIAK